VVFWGARCAAWPVVKAPPINPLHNNKKDQRRDAQDEFHSAAQARAWADGDFDADHGLAFDGVGRPAHSSRARGPIAVEAAAVRAPLLCMCLLNTRKKTSCI
jgi:hypothetical protein